MFKWKKLGKLFDPVDGGYGDWMQSFAQSPSVIIRNDCVKIYFCTRPNPSADGMYVSYLASIDVSKNNLLHITGVCKTPLLALGARGTFDEFGTNPVSAIQLEDEIRVYYAGWTRCESVPVNAAIGVAISHDGGQSFSRLGDGPVLSHSPDEPFMLGSPRVRRWNGKWYMWYVSGREWLQTGEKCEPVYKIRMATSNDGLKWNKHGRDLLNDSLELHECQACPDVYLSNGRYHMFFSFRCSHNYRTAESGYRMGYAFSDDLVNWTRHDDWVGLTVSESGWDSQMVSYPHVFCVDSVVYMLYQGNDMGRGGIGLAQLVEGPDGAFL